jgi:hypothetical protein
MELELFDNIRAAVFVMRPDAGQCVETVPVRVIRWPHSILVPSSGRR